MLRKYGICCRRRCIKSQHKSVISCAGLNKLVLILFILLSDSFLVHDCTFCVYLTHPFNFQYCALLLIYYTIHRNYCYSIFVNSSVFPQQHRTVVCVCVCVWVCFCCVGKWAFVTNPVRASQIRSLYFLLPVTKGRRTERWYWNRSNDRSAVTLIMSQLR